MISKYKFYHGALLAEIVDLMERDVSIGELKEEGRLTCYILDNKVGMYALHSSSVTNRWQFQLRVKGALEIKELTARCERVFVCLICGEDGFLSIDIADLVSPDVTKAHSSGPLGISVKRQSKEQYSVSIRRISLPKKYVRGFQPILDCLQ